MVVRTGLRNAGPGGPRPWLWPWLWSWWVDAAMLVVFLAITAAPAPVRELDVAVRDLVDAHRPYLAGLVAENVNRLGSGGVLSCACAVLAAVTGVRRRSWWPFAPVVAAFVVTAAVVQPLKWVFDRSAPHAGVGGNGSVALFGDPGGVSYPSGHAVNTIVWYGVICLLAAWLPRTARIWLRVAPPVLVTLAGTYLGFHWLTDMLAGLALGVPLAHVITRTRWPVVSPAGLARIGGTSEVAPVSHRCDGTGDPRQARRDQPHRRDYPQWTVQDRGLQVRGAYARRKARTPSTIRCSVCSSPT